MQQFVAGFVIAVLIVVPIVVLFVRKKSLAKSAAQRSAVLVRDKIQRSKNGHLEQLEELSKLTGEPLVWGRCCRQGVSEVSI